MDEPVYISGIIPSLKTGRGRVVRFSAHAWRACFPQGNAGSNPALSARNASQIVGRFVWERGPPFRGWYSSPALSARNVLKFRGVFVFKNSIITVIASGGDCPRSNLL